MFEMHTTLVDSKSNSKVVHVHVFASVAKKKKREKFGI